MIMRDKVIKFRVTSAAHAVWTKYAAASGHSLSEFMRAAINAKCRGHTADLKAVLVQLRAELNAAGNNLNQCARRLNSGEDVQPLSEALSSVRAAAVAVREALEEQRL